MKQTFASTPVCSSPTHPGKVIGIGLSDRWSQYCILDQAGTALEEDRVRTTPEALAARFRELPPTNFD